MGKPQSGQADHASSRVGPSQITYSLAGLPEAREPFAPSLEDLPPERREKVERIRKEIQGGKYDTREKLEMAIERLLKEIL